MAPVPRRPQQDRARRRDEARKGLLEVVERLLQEGASFAELSVERLVGEAGMSRSTFYVHFTDRGDLLRGWYEEAVAGAPAWWDAGLPATREQLDAALAAAVGRTRDQATLLAAVHDAATYDPAVRALVEATARARETDLEARLREGQHDGLVDPALPYAATAAWLVELEQRGVLRLAGPAGEEEVAGLVEAYAALVWKALLPCGEV